MAAEPGITAASSTETCKSEPLSVYLKDLELFEASFRIKLPSLTSHLAPLIGITALMSETALSQSAVAMVLSALKVNFKLYIHGTSAAGSIGSVDPGAAATAVSCHVATMGSLFAGGVG